MWEIAGNYVGNKWYELASERAAFGVTLVVIVAIHDVERIFSGARVFHLGEKDRGICRGRALVPAQNTAASGVVVGQGVRQGIVGIRVTTQTFGEIPGASIDVVGRRPELSGGKVSNAFGF